MGNYYKNDSGLPELRISRFYKDQVENNEFQGEAKKFIKEKIDSAQWFIEAIQQRRVTMVNVMYSIIKFQPEWFAGNMEFLRPLKITRNCRQYKYGYFYYQ